MTWCVKRLRTCQTDRTVRTRRQQWCSAIVSSLTRSVRSALLKMSGIRVMLICISLTNRDWWMSFHIHICHLCIFLSEVSAGAILSIFLKLAVVYRLILKVLCIIWTARPLSEMIWKNFSPIFLAALLTFYGTAAPFNFGEIVSIFLMDYAYVIVSLTLKTIKRCFLPRSCIVWQYYLNFTTK